jgi:acyl transferase domain-containing protein/NADPH:quinone reductase-like Zn-dependent oxidoreductase/NAD(P)-dependent dehydrogenase (short-subunit alcohol dehydrogenase family)
MATSPTMNHTPAEIAPIAVVGISCRLPGGANSPDELWQLLQGGSSAWSPVPADRFNEAAFYHGSADDANGTSNHRGGHFIHGDLRDFDHVFFRLSSQQAAAMDPQQRMLLEMTYEAFESAGWLRESLAGSNTSVHVAMFTNDYDRNLYKDPLDLPTYYITGIEKAILSNRISHVFDLRGPSITLDTACSGGLVALHQACGGLLSRESDTAIVAAPNLMLGPDHYIGMSNLHMLSDTGRSYPFDSRGVGYGRGEGLVVLALKRLDDALRDGDPIRTVIRSTAVNQDGHTVNGITYPNGAAQADLIRTAYSRAGLLPVHVSYIEAHGTGTVAGDHEELAALDQVFGQPDRSETLPLYVGSIKGNIGHTENSSGLASLVKASLILDHELIPPVANFASPKLGLPLDRINIPTQLVPLPRDLTIVPRVSINSFGFGGTNAHAILEQAPRSSQVVIDYDHDSATVPYLFVLSANNQISLAAMIESYQGWLDTHSEDDIPLADLSYTLCQRRSALSWRFQCVASDSSSLLTGLRRGLVDVAQRTKPTPTKTDLVFVFTGQGAQWLGMGRELLLESSPSHVFRDSICKSRDILLSLGATWDLEAMLLGHDANETLLNTAERAQPATTAVQVALVALLQAQGVRPHAVVGHSSGEIAAAFTAGHLSHRSALQVAFHRGFMAGLSCDRGLPRGAMMSVGLGESQAARFIDGLTRGMASIACVNSPNSITVSGDADAVDELAEHLAAHAKENNGAQIFHRRLVVDTAYHSYHMQAVADDYYSRLGDTINQNPAINNENEHGIAFISSVSGTMKSSGFDAAYWTANLTSPVRFCDAVQALAQNRYGGTTSNQNALFIEIGPHPALAGPVRQSLAGCLDIAKKLKFDYVSVLQRKMDAITSTLDLAGRMFEQGIPLNWDAVSALSTGSKVVSTVRTNLPTYAWDHSTKHWHESRISREYRMRREPYHDLLGVRIADSTQTEPRWRHMLSLASLPWLADHVIDGLAVFPASGFLCMAAEAVAQLGRERHSGRAFEMLALRHVSFHRALIIPERPHRIETQLSLRPLMNSTLDFTFSISALSDGQWYEHCTGTIGGVLAETKDAIELESQPPCQPANTVRAEGDDVNDIVIDTGAIYKQLSGAGNTYGPTFAGIRSLSLSKATDEAAQASQTKAVVGIPDVQAVMPARQQSPHIIHPTTLDVILHATVPMVVKSLGRGSVMPVHMDELLLCSTNELPRNPGEELSMSATLESSHFRTAHVDVSVFTTNSSSSNDPVISISGIEFRSLGSHASDQPQESTSAHAQNEGLCYELEWRADLDHIRSGPGCDQSLADLVSHICFKRAHISVVELGVDHCDVSLAFLDALKAVGGTLFSYDFVVHARPDLAQDVFEKARESLREYGDIIQYFALDPDMDTTGQGFVSQAADVVLVSNVQDLSRASFFTKENGVILIVFEYDAGNSIDSWSTLIQKICPNLQVHSAFCDTSRGSAVFLARPAGFQKSLFNTPVRILTGTPHQNSPSSWATALEARLRNRGVNVWLDSLHTDDITVNGHLGQGNELVIVADDGATPILSDSRCFSAAITLMKGSNRILWISPDSPMPMHQITGVARTAHAENDDLHLTTVHAAPELLQSIASQEPHNQLVDIILDCLRPLEKLEGDGERHCEREYRIKEDGTVLVPRLHHSKKLNHTVHADDSSIVSMIEPCRFFDPERPLVLSFPAETYQSHPNTHGSNVKAPVFIDDDIAATPLPEDAIEMEAQATAISLPPLLTSAIVSATACAGVVTKVGAAARQVFTIGDRVVGVGSTLGARARICSAHACHLPQTVPTTAGAALLLSTMAACYAFQGLSRLPSGQAAVLVHGATSLTGRAAIAVARSMNAHVAITAKNHSEALLLSDHYGIASSNVLVIRPSFHRPSLRQMFSSGIDVILQAGEDTVPSEAIAYLKPFASLVVVTGAPSRDNTRIDGSTKVKLPPNATIQSCDVWNLLRTCPSMTAGLVTQAMNAFKHLSISGLDLCIRDISQVSEALRLLNTSVYDQVVLQAHSDSFVPAVKPVDANSLIQHKERGWQSENGSYVVAGGLGDLGQRLLILMARRGAKHLITLSRRDADPENKKDLQAQLEAIQPGCQLYCLVCDITSEVHVKRVVETLIGMGLPPVRGVIQSAAIFEDGTLDTMTYDDFTRATLIKVDGTLTLAHAFASPDLTFFLMLSSVASIIGSSGQSSYNAGNAVQDALAQAESKTRGFSTACNFTSLNIGWIEDATVSIDNEARLSAFRRAGLKSIQPAELSAFFDFVLETVATGESLPQAVIGFDATSLASATTHNGTVHSALFCHVRKSSASAAASASSVAPESAVRSFAQVAASDSHEAIVDFIASAICGQIARLISIDLESIDQGDGSILALGLDSLVAIELRNCIMREFDAPLQSSELLVDQTVRALAEKVASRSRVLTEPVGGESSNLDSDADSNAQEDSQENNSTGRESVSATTPSSPSSVKEELDKLKLPAVPLPSLANTLRLFQDSRRAIDSPENQLIVEDAVRDFLDGPGPVLQQRLVDAGPDSIADGYERMLYLGRREPLQDFSEFSFGFPVEAPTHTQAQRAAVLTAAILDWASRLAADQIAPDTVHDTSLCTVGRDWLFYATRQPRVGVDQNERYFPNQTVAVLRRGHIFQLAPVDMHTPLDISALYTAYEGILKASEEPQLPIGTLTADDRDSWAQVR